MKMVVALIQPTKLSAVQAALAKLEVTRMTISDALGYGRQRGQTLTYRGNEYKSQLLRKIELQIVVNDDFLDRTIEAIATVARTGPEGTIGDGKIFVSELSQVIRIRTGETGTDAL